jgi:uncharacterized membrane protein YbhN (UPF0104 family)
VKISSRNGYWLKATISIVFLMLVFSRADLKGVMQAVLALPWWYLFLVSFMYLLAQIIAASRWWVVTPGSSLRPIIEVTFKSQHWVFLLPSSVTTDLIRITSNHVGDSFSHTRIAGIIVDRLLGLCTLVLIIGLALFIDKAFFNADRNQYLLAGSACVLGIAPIFIFRISMVVNAARIAGGWASSFVPKVLVPHYAEVLDSFIEIMTDSKRVSINVVLSFLAQLLSASIFLLYGSVFDFSITISTAIILSSVTQLVALFPIGIAGVGIRDYTVVGLLQTIGVDPRESIAASMSTYPVIVIFAVLSILLVHISRRSAV